MIQKRKQVADDVKNANKKLESARDAKFGEALKKAIMKSTITAILKGEDPPADASMVVVAEAKLKVRKLKKQAAKLHVVIDDEAIKRAVEAAERM